MSKPKPAKPALSPVPAPVQKEVLGDIQALIQSARQRAALAVNAELSLLNWQVGQRIHQEVLKGQRADYGKQLIKSLSAALTREYGKGWSKRQLDYCVRMAQVWPDPKIVHTLCSQLSWSHLRILMHQDDPLKRDFYIELARLENWSVRQLQERINSLLYERTALSKKPDTTIEHALVQVREQGQMSPDLLLKDPYVLDFLGLKDRYLEKDLEDAILRELEHFLMELGAGFTFVERQKRLQIDTRDYYIDLLFYNRKLRRLIVIELKIGEFKAEYKGQMELYLRWLAKHAQEEGEEAPLGIILCTGKNEEHIELLELDKSGIHVAEYLTVLPPRKLLEAKLQQALSMAQERIENKEAEA